MQALREFDSLYKVQIKHEIILIVINGNNQPASSAAAVNSQHMNPESTPAVAATKAGKPLDLSSHVFITCCSNIN